jgi:hypothetical protein
MTASAERPAFGCMGSNRLNVPPPPCLRHHWAMSYYRTTLENNSMLKWSCKRRLWLPPSLICPCPTLAQCELTAQCWPVVHHTSWALHR